MAYVYARHAAMCVYTSDSACCCLFCMCLLLAGIIILYIYMSMTCVRRCCGPSMQPHTPVPPPTGVVGAADKPVPVRGLATGAVSIRYPAGKAIT